MLCLRILLLIQDKPDIIHRPFQHHKVQRSVIRADGIVMYYMLAQCIANIEYLNKQTKQLCYSDMI